MNTVSDGGDWSIYVALFAVGGFPWITQLKALDIHFVYNGKSYKEIFNAFASLFSFSIFFFLKTAVTDNFARYFSFWWLTILISFVLVIAYIAIQMKSSDVQSVKKMIGVFVLYVTIFCTLVSGFGLLYFEKDYYMISGNVKNSKGRVVKLEIYKGKDAVKVIETDEDGDFFIALRKGFIYTKIIISTPDEAEDKTVFIYDPIFTAFDNLELD